MVLALAAAVRIALGLLNRQANDDHMIVTTLFRRIWRRPFGEWTLPGAGEPGCWECFQPKLYHATAAAVGLLAPPEARIVAAQLLNVGAGLVTVWIVLRFLRRYCGDARARLLTLALVALNPDLVGINAQATNDSFVILWGTLALLGAVRLAEQPRLRHILLATVPAILAGLTKGNGLVTGAVVAIVLGAGAGARLLTAAPDRRRVVAAFLAFCVAWGLLVPWLGQYLESRSVSGSSFAHMPLDPTPPLFRETFVQQPGVTSIVHAYFTFRLVDLVRDPIIRRGGSYPRHRTSLWSQLYGRTHFVHFSAVPRSWRTDAPAILNLGRVIMLVALVPTALFALGAGSRALAWAGALRARDLGRLGRSPFWVLDLAAAAFLAFAVAYTFRHRDFSTMKAIFIYPGILAFAHLFLTGYQTVVARLRDRPGLRRAIHWVIVLLVGLYVADLVILIEQLATRAR